jgi:hypothetical protein
MPQATSQPGERKDFFISYASADQAWAKWIAWELGAQGYTTFLQDWDFGPAANFIALMHEGARNTDYTLALLSPSYFRSDYATAEWAAILAPDPLNEGRRLVPVRVADCRPEGLLGLWRTPTWPARASRKPAAPSSPRLSIWRRAAASRRNSLPSPTQGPARAAACPAFSPRCSMSRSATGISPDAAKRWSNCAPR